MKAIMFAIILALPGWAAIAASVDTVDEKSFDLEAEQMDVYDNAQLEKAARQESDQMDRDIKNMDTKIADLKHRNENIKNNTKKQAERYTNTKKLHAEVARRVQAEDQKRKSLEKDLSGANYRLTQAQHRLESSHQHLSQIQGEIHDLNHEKTNIEARIHRAEQQLAANERKYEALDSKRKSLKKSVVDLNRQAQNTERQVDKSQARLAALR